MTSIMATGLPQDKAAHCLPSSLAFNHSPNLQGLGFLPDTYGQGNLSGIDIVLKFERGKPPDKLLYTIFYPCKWQSLRVFFYILLHTHKATTQHIRAFTFHYFTIFPPELWAAAAVTSNYCNWDAFIYYHFSPISRHMIKDKKPDTRTMSDKETKLKKNPPHQSQVNLGLIAITPTSRGGQNLHREKGSSTQIKAGEGGGRLRN